MVFNYLIKLIEFIILFLIVLEDEESREISIYKLTLLLTIQIINIFYFKQEINMTVIFISVLIFSTVYILARGGFGLGDVIIGIIFSLSFFSVKAYYYFFTISFCLGALYSIILIMTGRANFKSKLAFAKFLVTSYYMMLYMGGRV